MPDEPTLPPPDENGTLEPPAPPIQATPVHHGSPVVFHDEPTLPEHIGRYEIRGELGEGTFGVVYRAYDPQLDREIALKLTKTPTDAARSPRFRREAHAAAGLRHPNIVPLYEAGDWQGRAYLASAFIDGQTLHDALNESPMESRLTAELVRKLAEAVGYAHAQGVIHRDVKTSNVMLDGSGEPHLLDFGLARRMEDSAKRTQDGAVLGTPAYLAPEVCGGKASRWSPAADQYALGVVLYELLTGRVPFEGPMTVVLALHQSREPEPMAARGVTVPADLEAVCRKCLEKDSGRRYSDCAAVAEDLRRWFDGLATAARPLSVIERLRRWMGKNRALAAALTAAALLLIVGASISTAYAVQANRLIEQRDVAIRDRAKTAKTLIKFFRENPQTLWAKREDFLTSILMANPELSRRDLEDVIRGDLAQAPDTSMLAEGPGGGGSSAVPNMFGD